MMIANKESDAAWHAKNEIVTGNFLDASIKHPTVDMIITSPPYVTSYEYADLHQLSSLWLGYTEDYRELRNGSIGSLYHVYNFDKELKRLNNTGTEIVFRLLSQYKSKARAVAKYFLTCRMSQKLVFRCFPIMGLHFLLLETQNIKGSE